MHACGTVAKISPGVKSRVAKTPRLPCPSRLTANPSTWAPDVRSLQCDRSCAHEMARAVSVAPIEKRVGRLLLRFSQPLHPATYVGLLFCFLNAPYRYC
jgi:hypothetical protein